MKNQLNLSILLFAALLFFLVGCKKTGQTKNGYASVTINGKDWPVSEVGGMLMPDSTISISLDKGKRIYGCEYPEFFVFSISQTTERQFFYLGGFGFPRSSFTVANCDYPLGSFEPGGTDTTNNWIQITEEEDGYQKVKGAFSTVLVRVQRDEELPDGYPDTLRVEGVFEIQQVRKHFNLE